MASLDEHILRTAKEIVVKFIEIGRISPASFHESFREIYKTIKNTVNGNDDDAYKTPIDDDIEE
ncbi:MAG: conjugal transfer protein TraB [Desulfobacterales bacterium]|nr:conjugal transfer protein TraB [Desulfobacterales bacterium]